MKARKDYTPNNPFTRKQNDDEKFDDYEDVTDKDDNSDNNDTKNLLN